MSTDAHQDSGEKQLCLSCMASNDPSAHFCVKCGAPLSSYAATAPFESVFAEGFVYRQAAERPRRFIVVFGIWIIFGIIAGGSLMMIIEGFVPQKIFGLFVFPLSIVMLWKTTKNYFCKKKVNDKSDA